MFSSNVSSPVWSVTLVFVLSIREFPIHKNKLQDFWFCRTSFFSDTIQPNNIWLFNLTTSNFWKPLSLTDQRSRLSPLNGSPTSSTFWRSKFSNMQHVVCTKKTNSCTLSYWLWRLIWRKELSNILNFNVSLRVRFLQSLVLHNISLSVLNTL